MSESVTFDRSFLFHQFMDSKETFRRPVNSISEPVYSTPNNLPSSSPSPSSLTPPSRSPRLPSPLSSTITSQPGSFAFPPVSQVATNPSTLNLNLDSLNDSVIKNINIDWDCIAAVAQNLPPVAPIVSVVPSDPKVIAQKLTELLQKEEEITDRRKKLEIELAEIRSKENDLHQQRSELIRQLDKVFSPQSNASSRGLTSSQASSLPTTTIERINKEPTTPRSFDLNASINASMTKKRPGPASKTGLPGMKQINPGSLPPLGSISSLSKKPQKNGVGSAKGPATTGVKQSRPQPMRARKRNKPNETDSEPQLNTPSQNQANNGQQTSQQIPRIQSQPLLTVQPQLQPKPQSQTQPQPQPQPKQKPQTPLKKIQLSTNNDSTLKEDVKPSINNESPSSLSNLQKFSPLKPNPFKERIESNTSEPIPTKVKIKQEPGDKPKKTDASAVISRDANTYPIKSNQTRGSGVNDEDDDDAHSDSDIFEALGNIVPTEEDPENEVNEGPAKKIKSETGEPIVTQIDAQQKSRLEIKIKKEK